MNRTEAAACLTQMHAWWPAGPDGRGWTEPVEHAWLDDFVQIEFEDAATVLRQLHDETESRFAPAWGTINMRANALASDRYERVAQEQAALERASYDPTAGDWPKVLAMARKAIKAAQARGDHIHRRGWENCPECGRHDHSNTTAFGFTVTRQRAFKTNKDGETVTSEHHEAVPGWLFDCPGCGDPDAAQGMCSTWTEAGIVFMKALGQRVAAVEDF